MGSLTLYVVYVKLAFFQQEVHCFLRVLKGFCNSKKAKEFTKVIALIIPRAAEQMESRTLELKEAGDS